MIRAYRWTAWSLLFLVLAAGCRQDRDKDMAGRILLLMAFANWSRPVPAKIKPWDPNSPIRYDYLSLFNRSLDSWQTGFVKNLTAPARIMGTATTVSSPKNWFTATGDDCKGMGVPAVSASSCAFANPSSVIGVCWSYADSSTGEILESTAIARRSFVERWPATDAVAERYRVSLVAHELAHCFGLKHFSDPARVMNPYLTEALPAPVEVAGAQYVYFNPVGDSRPPIAPHSDLFNQLSSGLYRRHLQFPEFVISSEIIPSSIGSSEASLMEELRVAETPACARVTGDAAYGECLVANNQAQLLPEDYLAPGAEPVLVPPEEPKDQDKHTRNHSGRFWTMHAITEDGREWTEVFDSSGQRLYQSPRTAVRLP